MSDVNVTLYVKGKKGKLKEVDWEPYDYDAAYEIALLVDSEIGRLLRKKGEEFAKEIIEARREILEDEDYDDPELTFMKKVMEPLTDRIVKEALEEIKKREIKLLYADGEYEIL
ncbi:MAG: hypothetical protein QW308_03940 [Candidatus Woesearchaeota archaeon]